MRLEDKRMGAIVAIVVMCIGAVTSGACGIYLLITKGF